MNRKAAHKPTVNIEALSNANITRYVLTTSGTQHTSVIHLTFTDCL